MDERHEAALNAVNEYVRYKNAHDLQGLIQTIDDDCEFIVVGIGVTFRGPEEASDYHRDMFKAFPDYHLSGGPISVDPDYVVWEGTLSGTHTGRVYGAEPTGRRFEVPTIAVFPVRNGKVAGERGYFDMLSILAQLGVVTPPKLPW